MDVTSEILPPEVLAGIVKRLNAAWSCVCEDGHWFLTYGGWVLAREYPLTEEGCKTQLARKLAARIKLEEEDYSLRWLSARLASYENDDSPLCR